MSGPRVTSGEDSKQDYATPADFMAAVEQRFGKVQFDLAAHRLNKQHERYFAPLRFIETYDPKKHDAEATVNRLVDSGADPNEAVPQVAFAAARSDKTKLSIKNIDPDCFAYDAFAFDWASISDKFRSPTGGPGLLWNNCEFSDVGPWAKKHATCGPRGANSLLLTPSVTGANWSTDHVFAKADVYLLKGRLMFDGKNVFPKDCMLSSYSPNATGACHVWDWKRDVLVHSWARTTVGTVSEVVELEPAAERQGSLL